MIADVKRDLTQQYVPIEITAAVVQRAMDVAEVHGLRGYDAIQLAASQELHIECVAKGASMVLVCSDDELSSAAIAEGLFVEDPLAHP